MQRSGQLRALEKSLSDELEVDNESSLLEVLCRRDIQRVPLLALESSAILDLFLRSCDDIFQQGTHCHGAPVFAGSAARTRRPAQIVLDGLQFHSAFGDNSDAYAFASVGRTGELLGFAQGRRSLSCVANTLDPIPALARFGHVADELVLRD